VVGGGGGVYQRNGLSCGNERTVGFGLGATTLESNCEERRTFRGPVFFGEKL